MGQYAPGAGTSCDECIAGLADLDMDASTPCDECGVGIFTSGGNISCTACSLLGGLTRTPIRRHHARCAGPGHSQREAEAPLARCVRLVVLTWTWTLRVLVRCVQRGSTRRALATVCTDCVAGSADIDSDPSTSCVLCVQGQYAAPQSVECETCGQNLMDHDSQASTPCVESCEWVCV